MSKEEDEFRKKLEAARAADNNTVLGLAAMTVIGLLAGAGETGDASMLVAAAIIGGGAWWWISW